MHDLKRVTDDFAGLRQGLERRGAVQGLDAIAEMAAQRKAIIADTQVLQQERNAKAKAMKGASKEEIDLARTSMRELSDAIKKGESALRQLEEDLRARLLVLPNIPFPEVPQGKGEDDNPVIRVVGEKTQLDFEAKSHDELGVALGVFDFERAAKVSGARFAFLRGAAAKMERALISFMLDLHTARGDQEMLPPYLVRPESMLGTGQLPKFKDDAFHADFGESSLYLIPTAEVPVTNYHADEIIDEADLPLRYVAFTPCFRSEAGSAGRDTKGLIRQHQFHKVEMVRFVKAEDSAKEHEALVDQAEEILRQLELPYRVVELCTGDLGFSAAKCYDIEVWLPSQQSYREISSCSNFADFQARRANIRYRPDTPKAKPKFLHTLNGSGLAVGRTLVAIFENYQQADGSVRVPKALQSYMGGLEIIRKAD